MLLRTGMQTGEPYLSDEHFTVDGTLIEAWALPKSFQCKDDGFGQHGDRFHGDRRSNQTHESQTVRTASCIAKSGSEARLCYLGHTPVENGSGLIVGTIWPKPADMPSVMPHQ